jgi:hypothetical protein
MFLPLTTTLLTLFFLSTLTSSTNPRKCCNDSCLRSFERHREHAQRYCAEHPNKFYMSPAPAWVGDQCRSLGRMNNKRMRLASACDCLEKAAAATGEAAYVAEPVSSITSSTVSNIQLSVSSTEATSGGVVVGPSSASTGDAAAAAATTTTDEEGVVDGK